MWGFCGLRFSLQNVVLELFIFIWYNCNCYTVIFIYLYIHIYIRIWILYIYIRCLVVIIFMFVKTYHSFSCAIVIETGVYAKMDTFSFWILTHLNRFDRLLRPNIQKCNSRHSSEFFSKKNSKFPKICIYIFSILIWNKLNMTKLSYFVIQISPLKTYQTPRFSTQKM